MKVVAIAALVASVMGCDGAAESVGAVNDSAPEIEAPELVAQPAQPVIAAQAATAWPPAECDEVYELRAYGGASKTSPYSIPAGAEIHPQIYHDAPWPAGSQAIATKPITDNAKVVHHWILFSGIAFLSSWAPGKEEAVVFPPDVGMELPTGPRSLRLDMHYFNKGGRTAVEDRSGIAICVVKAAKARKNVAAVHMGFTKMGVLAPANRRDYEATTSCRVTARQPVTLLTAGPHAHKLAKHMKFSVRKASGQQIVLHDGPFAFGEESLYFLDPPVVLNTGDTVTTTCVFDNPTMRNVSFGDSTEDEMCFNFAMYYPKGALNCGLL
jgi:hypothetical protein